MNFNLEQIKRDGGFKEANGIGGQWVPAERSAGRLSPIPICLGILPMAGR